MDENILYWLALGHIEGLGVRGANSLVQRFSSPQAVYAASFTELEGCGLAARVARDISAQKGIKRGGAGNSESRETRRASGDALYGSLSVSAEADCGPAIGTLCEGRCTHTFSACGCHSGDTPPQRLRQFGGAPPGG